MPIQGLDLEHTSLNSCEIAYANQKGATDEAEAPNINRALYRGSAELLSLEVSCINSWDSHCMIASSFIWVVPDTMPGIYLSLQRVRFSSPDAYSKFKLLFADTRRHLMQLPGFLHLTWRALLLLRLIATMAGLISSRPRWEHLDDPILFNECSLWTSRGAL